MSSDVLESLENLGWNSWDVTTLRLESVFVSHVGHLDNFTVRRGVSVTALSFARFGLSACVINIADLLRLDTICRLVAIAVASVWIWTVRALPQNGNRRGARGIHIQRSAGCYGSEDAQDDCLERKRFVQLSYAFHFFNLIWVLNWRNDKEINLLHSKLP